MIKSPRIYLVLDNCFAIKRWVRPVDWMNITYDLGFRYVQTSSDNEIDPLFSTPEYMDEWFEAVKKCERTIGVKVANFYTGYQTYRTVGLAHYNLDMVEHLKKNWFFRLIDKASGLGAKGLGFSMFAIPDGIMQSKEQYDALEDRIIGTLREIADYAHAHDHFQVSFEQMYVPYQPPFTIRQTERYLEKCATGGGRPFYVTLDTGHMIGQAKFQKPDREQLLESFNHDGPYDVWLGSDRLYEVWRKFKNNSDYINGADAILRGIEDYPHMFADEVDVDEYLWFEKLAKYSPIIHMQQTDGVRASHAPFTRENNEKGIITGERLLRAIKKSYEDTREILAPVDDIYLSFELFFANTDKKQKIFEQLRETVVYWRQFVPEDGMTLDEIISRMDVKNVSVK